AEQYQQQQPTEQQAIPNNTQDVVQPINQSSNFSVPQIRTNIPQYIPQQPPTNMARTPTSKKKLSKKAKIGIGLGIAALLGTGAYFIFRNKDDEEDKSEPAHPAGGNKSKPKKSPEKKSLGSISLQ
ncbi:MAG: hypothetical protein KAS04_03490, partial [Candidatus Aenigmarchaeota archaeon]|nr:hypothetical protein [Candidatus Aenigmarchaeota archaeon]